MSGGISDLGINELLEIVRDENKISSSRTLAAEEILRRERLAASNTKKIAERLLDYEQDERGHYPVATVFENAPLALIQVKLETGRRELKWVLNILSGAGDGQ